MYPNHPDPETAARIAADRNRALTHITHQLGKQYFKEVLAKAGNVSKLIERAYPTIDIMGLPKELGPVDFEHLGLTAEQATQRRAELAAETPGTDGITVGGSPGKITNLSPGMQV
mgnify:CR=1 FL=1